MSGKSFLIVFQLTNIFCFKFCTWFWLVFKEFYLLVTNLNIEYTTKFRLKANKRLLTDLRVISIFMIFEISNTLYLISFSLFDSLPDHTAILDNSACRQGFFTMPFISAVISAIKDFVI